MPDRRLRALGVIGASVLVCGISAVAISAVAPTNAGAQSAVPINLSPPVITGEARDGQTLSASTGQWLTLLGTAYHFQWQRCAPTCANIDGATSSRYTLTSSEVDHTVRVVVTATSLFGTSKPAESAPTATVVANAPRATAPPSVSGTAHIGFVLVALPAIWSGSGPPATTYTYQWYRCLASGFGCGPVPGATADAYALGPKDVGRTLRVMETATNSAGKASAVSAASKVVAGNEPLVPIADVRELLRPVTGSVLVRVPRARSFVPIQRLTVLPNRSIVDTTRGTATVIVARYVGGRARSNVLTRGGLFRVNQQGSGAPVTGLSLIGSLAGCTTARAAADTSAHAARHRPRKRRLFASGHGNYQTNGLVASAAVRGTTWVTQDTCQGTLVQAVHGVVEVHDRVHNRVVVVPAPLSYFTARR